MKRSKTMDFGKTYYVVKIMKTGKTSIMTINQIARQYGRLVNGEEVYRVQYRSSTNKFVIQAWTNGYTDGGMPLFPPVFGWHATRYEFAAYTEAMVDLCNKLIVIDAVESGVISLAE